MCIILGEHNEIKTYFFQTRNLLIIFLHASLYLQCLLRGNVWLCKELILHAASQLRFLLKQPLHIQHQPGEPNLDKQARQHERQR